MACLKFRTRWAVEECLKTFEEISLSKFVHYNSSKLFSNDDWRPVYNGHIYWEWNKADVQTAPIPFDGIPFMFVGHQHLSCHQGVDLAKRRKSDYISFKRNIVAQSNVLMHNRIRTQSSKKVGCPALIRITRIAKFPQFKLSSKITLFKKRELGKELKQKLLENPSSVDWHEIYYVCLPSIKEHVGHPVALQDAIVPVARMDERVEVKIVELTREGVRNVGEMKVLIERFIESHLKDDSTPGKSLLPSDLDIRSVMHQVREEMYKETDSTFHVQSLPNQDDQSQNALKNLCFDHLHSIINEVVKVKGKNPQEDLAHSLENIHPSPTASRTNRTPDEFKPIKIIVESSSCVAVNPREYFNSTPLSIVEIAVHDDALYDEPDG